ncbi:MAG: lysylphosphatidylglycerol synthase transmembrane domain-containing protein [Flavobacteriales bacterium]
MKFVLKVLKIAVPLALGIYLAWYSFDSIQDKDKVAQVMGRANYFFIALSVIFSWCSHFVRALRWKYLLEPMGYQPRVWNSYHATMIGYFMNLLLPRAGEVSRAGMMTRYEKIPFEKVFGTILAERVVDVFMLGMVSFITIALQYDKFIELKDTFSAMSSSDQKSSSWISISLVVLSALLLAGIVLYLIHPKVRTKVNALVSGLFDGLLAILRLKKRWEFLGLTFLIWILYILLYLVCFYSIAETSQLELKALLLGFLGGSLGIILVQGGVGVYPVLVASALVMYGADYDLVIALGWVTWAAQTLLLVVAGAVSFYLMPRMNEKG